MTWTVALAALYALAPASPASCPTPTGLGATIIVPASPAATLPEGTSPTDMVIEVHTAKGGCVGTGRWSGGAVAISLWADDPTTDSVEGFVDGEPAELVVTDVATGKVFRGGDIEFDYEDGFDVTAGLEVDRVYVVSESGRRHVAVGEREGWASLAAAGADFLSPLWTQGHPGADDEGGTATVYRYGPSAGFEPLAVAPGELPAGAGVVAYLFDDNDLATPEVDGFPKLLPTPSEPAFPFAFPLDGGVPSDQGAPADGGWHLLGNPSARAIDWDADGWERSDVSDVVYVYDGQRYRAWTGQAGSLGSGVIAPGQGFWVRSTSETPSLTVPSSARRSGAAGGDAGNGPSGVIQLELGGPGGASRTLAVVPTPGGELAFDGLDALALPEASDAGPRLVAWAGGPSPYALEVAAVPAYDEALSGGGSGWDVGLDVLSATETDGLAVSWPSVSVPDGWSLKLTDTETGKTVDLLTSGSYTFDAPANVEGDPDAGAFAPPPAPSEIRPSDLSSASDGPRFVLKARNDGSLVNPAVEPPEATLHSPAPNPVRASTSLSYELGTPGPARLSVLDALGREVAVVQDVAHADGLQSVRFDSSGLSAGVYVLRLESDGAPVAAAMTVVR